jgi:hypothetical protein
LLKINKVYSSPDMKIKESRRKRWARHVGRTEGMVKAYKNLVGKPEVKVILGRLAMGW